MSKDIRPSLAWPMMPPATAGKHLGLKLSDEVGRLLELLLEDERKKVGPHATVSAASFVTGLIVKEAERRKLVNKKR